MSQKSKRVLLTGATGYVGGRLRSLLEQRDFQLRCMVRRPENLRGRVSAATEVVKGDVFDEESLALALDGVDTAYYLIHSMGTKGSFESQDRVAAENFARAARNAGVRRIIYLGGLGDEDQRLSPHLRSRHEVGRILGESGCQVIELRASIVIGSGSLSFELVRALVERLPVMICPKWVSTQAQPIAIEDLLDYLLAALDWEGGESRIFEIGGPDIVTYGEIMKEYARQRGLPRWMITVPVLTPRLSSLWLGLVTPVFARIGRKLVESMRNPTVINDPSAGEIFDVKPRGLREAVSRALINEDREFAETRWSDALSSSGEQRSWGGVRFGSRIVDSRNVSVPVSPAQAFAPIRRIGGHRGWYYANFLWTLRGWLDLLAGGIGIRRGRRDPEELCVGDTLDFWRVVQYEPDKTLRLAAEMKVPGRAWLEFEVTPNDDGGSTIRQTGSVLNLCGCEIQHGFKQLVEFPNVSSQFGHHGGAGAFLAGLARHPSLPAVIVIRGEHRESRFQVFELLGKAVCQAIQPLQEQPLRSVQPLHVARAYRPLTTFVYTADSRSLRSDHFRWRVDHRRVAILFDYHAELCVRSKGKVHGFRVGRESVRADLDDRLVLAGDERMGIGFVWFREYEPSGHVGHEPPSVVG